MKKTLIITVLVVLIISIGSIGYRQYVKANETFTDYALTKEKIQINHDHEISVGKLKISNLDANTVSNELTINMDMTILKNKGSKYEFEKNLDGAFNLFVDDLYDTSSGKYELKNSKYKTTSETYDKYEAHLSFSTKLDNIKGKHKLELVYLDRNGHKLKKLYLPIRVDGGKIV